MAAPASSAQTERARIRTVDLAPVTVRGTGFHSGERVSVTVSAKASSTKIVAATAVGTWRVVFKRRLASCQAYSIRAVGAAGSRAFVKVTPMCPQP
jgi:hypothetical protein